MEEKKVIYGIISDIWDVTKRYAFDKMDDAKWEAFVNEITAKSESIRKDNELHAKLYVGMILAVQDYMERTQKKNGI